MDETDPSVSQSVTTETRIYAGRSARAARAAEAAEHRRVLFRAPADHATAQPASGARSRPVAAAAFPARAQSARDHRQRDLHRHLAPHFRRWCHALYRPAYTHDAGT